MSMEGMEGGVAVMDAPAVPEAGSEPTPPPTPPPPSSPPAPPAPPQHVAIEKLDVEAILAEEFTSAQLKAARLFVLNVVQSGNNNGFGAKCGPMIRETIGYEFDAKELLDALADMASDDFLTRYQKQVEKWHGRLKTTGVSEATIAANLKKKNDALTLVDDKLAFHKLVKSLLIVCKRNQPWTEEGDHIKLSYNGHGAVLALFGITVTAKRRRGLKVKI